MGKQTGAAKSRIGHVRQPNFPAPTGGIVHPWSAIGVSNGTPSLKKLLSTLSSTDKLMLSEASPGIAEKNQDTSSC